MIHNENIAAMNKDNYVTRKAIAATKMYADGVGTELPDPLKVVVNFAIAGVGASQSTAEHTAKMSGSLGAVFLEYYRKFSDTYEEAKEQEMLP